MKPQSVFALFALLLLAGVTAFAAEPATKASGGFAPAATIQGETSPAPTSKASSVAGQPSAAVGPFYFAIPYSFENVHKDASEARIVCWVSASEKIEGYQSSAVAGGSTTVVLKGKPQSGTAYVYLSPQDKSKNLNDIISSSHKAWYYLCDIDMIISSQGAVSGLHPAVAKPWAKNQQNSILSVTSQVPPWAYAP
jgi:hypothetical protein